MKYLPTIAFFIVMISGCAPEAVDDSSEPTAVSLAHSAELEKIDVQAGESIEDRELVADLEPKATVPPDSEAQEEDLVAPSGSVDLSELESLPSRSLDTGKLVVQPAPGNPDTQLKMEELAREDLANRLEIALDEIVTVSIEFVEWSDGSLGCAERGMMYIQVLTPGYLVLFEADGEQFEYHTDTNNNVVLCEDGRPVSPD